MRVTCPSCHAEASLELLLGREADAQAVAAYLERSVPFGALLLQYIALFRPAQRRLSLARAVALVGELLPDLQRQAIARKGRDWPTTDDLWRSALQTVVAMRDHGRLSLPLTTHGLLYEVLASLANKREAQAETEREAARRSQRGSATAAGPVNLAAMAADLAAGEGGAPAAAPPPVYTGPSRAAREIKARMAASRARLAGGDPASAAIPDPDPDAQETAP